jgi:hypothetical protein
MLWRRDRVGVGVVKGRSRLAPDALSAGGRGTRDPSPLVTFSSRDQEPTCAEVPLFQVPAPYFRGRRKKADLKLRDTEQQLPCSPAGQYELGIPEVGMVTGRGYRRLRLLFKTTPLLPPPFIVAQKIVSVAGEIWVASFISFEKCGFLTGGNVRRVISQDSYKFP